MTRAALAILLPPSEGKADGGTGAGWSVADGRFGAALGPARAAIADALRAACGGDEGLLGVGGSHLERARVANRALEGAPTLPARCRYTGVVWDHLSLATLPVGARRRASSSVVAFSGLLGLVGIDDPTPPYRLKMGARLAPLGVLSTWWRPLLTAMLDEWLAGRHVVDLLPKEHAKAWVPDPGCYASLSRVSFVERSVRVVGHEAKAAKGLLARHLLLSTGDPRKALATFTHERFDLVVSA